MSEDALERFLSDMKAERKSATFEQMTAWLKAQRELRRYFSELKEKKFIVQENMDEAIDFDFIIRKGDFELIGVMQHKENSFLLSHQKLEELYQLLSNNPQSQAILLMWLVEPSYPSVIIFSEALNRILREGKTIHDFTSCVKPLKESVELFFKKSESMLFSITQAERSLNQQAKNIMLREVFRAILAEQFAELKNRKFRNDYKIKASQAFSMDDLEHLEAIFDLSLEKKLDESTIKPILSEISKVEKH